MPRLRLNLDQETYERLLEQAVAERRPIVSQADVAIQQALGLAFPSPDAPETGGGPGSGGRSDG